MSELSNRRHALVRWAIKHNHTLEEITDLVDEIEGRSELVQYAFSDDDRKNYEDDLEEMRSDVKIIFEKLTK